jgi:hypothetical protein
MTTCETRTSEQGNPFSSALLRSFIETVLQHVEFDEPPTLGDRTRAAFYDDAQIVEPSDSAT